MNRGRLSESTSLASCWICISGPVHGFSCEIKLVAVFTKRKSVNVRSKENGIGSEIGGSFVSCVVDEEDVHDIIEYFLR